jgi:hypothetical protein
MEEIAWIIRTKDVNRPAGFIKQEECDGEKDGELEAMHSE